jgi:hypothetical protein
LFVQSDYIIIIRTLWKDADQGIAEVEDAKKEGGWVAKSIICPSGYLKKQSIKKSTLFSRRDFCIF